MTWKSVGMHEKAVSPFYGWISGSDGRNKMEQKNTIVKIVKNILKSKR